MTCVDSTETLRLKTSSQEEIDLVKNSGESLDHFKLGQVHRTPEPPYTKVTFQNWCLLVLIATFNALDLINF